MYIYIDCEWNSYKGELISMALVPREGVPFYEVLECKNPHPWVAENVIPVLNKDSISYDQFQANLQEYLQSFDDVIIIADWPEDIAYFCNALIIDAGDRLDTPRLEFHIERVDPVSELPHNALEDAKALKKHLNRKRDCF